jgi:lambda family phage portal protein
MESSIGLFEKAIRYFSPARALDREKARYKLDNLERVRGFEGAKLGRRTQGWKATGTSANSEVLPALSILRSRARDMVRNNPYARRALNVLVRAMVGTGVIAKFEKLSDKEIWDAWCKECDADGLSNFAGLLDLIERTRRESGECLVRFRIRRADDGLTVPLQLQVLEPDHLDLHKNERFTNGTYIQGGIQFDSIGRRQGYWLFPEHPGEHSTVRSLRLDSVFVPASEVIHYFKRDRPSQIRGYPDLAVIMLRLRDIDDYEDAEIVRKKLEACFSVFVTRTDDAGYPPGIETDAKKLVEKLQPGLITRLNQGEGVEFANPQANGGYSEYLRTALRAVAVGLGMTYEQLTGDLSSVNYSSIRAGLLEFRRMIEAEQWNLMEPSLLDPIMKKFVLVANIYGKAVRPAKSWTMPRLASTDPLKEILADKEAIKAGIKSLTQVIGESGSDRDQVFAELSKDKKDLEALGVYVDSDAAVSEGLVKLAAQEDYQRDIAGSEVVDQEFIECLKTIMQS